MPDAELDRIRADIAARVLRETYDAQREALAYQISDLRRDVEVLQKAVDDDAKERRDAADRARLDRQRLRQWMIAAIVIPLLALAVNVALVLLT